MLELQIYTHGLLAHTTLVDIDTLCENDTDDCIDLVDMAHALDEYGYYEFTMSDMTCRILDCPKHTLH